MPNKVQLIKLIINVVVLGALLVISQQAGAEDWYPVRGGITFGISGITLLEQQKNFQDFLIVHDNKKNQGRLAIISIKDKNKVEYFPLSWQTNTELPIDLEAITSVPGKTNSNFIA